MIPRDSGLLVFTRFSRFRRLALAALGGGVATYASLRMPGSVFVWLGVLWMIAYLGMRVELRMDLQRRRYRRIDGTWPFIMDRSGSLDEIKAIRLDAMELPPTTFDQGQKRFRFQARMAWNDRTRSWFLFESRDFEQFSSAVRDLAETTGLSVIEGSILRRSRAELGPAPYDAHLAPLPEPPPLPPVWARNRPGS